MSQVGTSFADYLPQIIQSFGKEGKSFVELFMGHTADSNLELSSGQPPKERLKADQLPIGAAAVAGVFDWQSCHSGRKGPLLHESLAKLLLDLPVVDKPPPG